jgi:hypothetical protein
MPTASHQHNHHHHHHHNQQQHQHGSLMGGGGVFGNTPSSSYASHLTADASLLGLGGGGLGVLGGGGGGISGGGGGISGGGGDLDKEKEKQARENHCEIERRRRVKMAAYFNELCVMVPTCNTLQRKPDKLTILRMASSHMRNLRQNAASSQVGSGSGGNGDTGAYKPSFLTDQELKHLILEAADGFLFVAQCDTANIIYVSDALQPVLAYSPVEWVQHSLFEFVHLDDLDKVVILFTLTL